jgi:hypothetical protein
MITSTSYYSILPSDRVLCQEKYPEFAGRLTICIDDSKGKSKITVRFQAQTKDSTAGGIFGLRILKTNQKTN